MAPSAPPCTDGMKWVADLNLDDHNMKAPPVLAPGQRFIKSWRVRNTGTCAWDASYRLVYVQGNVPDAWMGGQPVPIPGTVIAGATCDLSVELTAPATPGVYQGTWQMQNGQGQLFGERIWVGIQVPAPVAAVPPPPAGPSIRFAADRTQIQPGERVSISWDVEGVREVYFYAQGEPWQARGVTGHEQREVRPAVSTTCELRVVKLDGTVEIHQVHIQVAATASATIRRFDASPAHLARNECTIFTWEFEGSGIQAARITRNGEQIHADLPPSGQARDCPGMPGRMVYRLELWLASGQLVAQEAWVDVGW